MILHKYIISLLDEGGDIEGGYEFETNWGLENLQYVAEAGADQFFHEHDGWDYDWPLKFALFDAITEERLGVFEVQLESVPTFYAKEIVDGE